MSGVPLAQLCNVEDVDTTTGVCAHPYWGAPPSVLPALTLEEGVVVAFAIGACWTLGLIARLYIRAMQQGMRY